MDQSQSNKTFKIPKRTLATEFFVGLFAIFALISAGYLSVGLGGLELNSSKYYQILAEFDNVSGLNSGASVEIAGVKIGDVAKIDLEKTTNDTPPSFAIVTLRILKGIPILDDDIASIRTKGIIGDRYVKISRGSSDVKIEPGGRISETESIVDLEDLLGKFIHSFEADKEEEA